MSDWRDKFPKDAADLAWWEDVFGSGSVAGWTGRHSALIRTKVGVHDVNASLRDLVADLLSNDPTVAALRAELEEALAVLRRIARGLNEATANEYEDRAVDFRNSARAFLDRSRA